MYDRCHCYTALGSIGDDDGVGVVQEPFPSVREPKVHRPVVGDSLTLRCEPPYGYPPGIVYWGESKAGDKLKPIENNERVSLDYEGTYSMALPCQKGCVTVLLQQIQIGFTFLVLPFLFWLTQVVLDKVPGAVKRF